jgi:hypothetical protein
MMTSTLLLGHPALQVFGGFQLGMLALHIATHVCRKKARMRDHSVAARSDATASQLRPRLLIGRLQSGKALDPGIAMAAHLITALKQRRHVFLVERRIGLDIEIGR